MASSVFQVGVCLFDDPKAYGNRAVRGWACLNGEEPFEVSCIGNLPSNAYWLTNIPENICLVTGLSSNPRIFHSGYLRTQVSSILLELGLKDADLASQSIILCDVFNRVISMADLMFGVDIPPKRTLAGGLAELHGIPHAEQTVDIEPAFYEACQSFSSCERRNTQPLIWTTLTFHRFQHALSLLSSPVPNGRFHFIPNSELPPPSQRLEWFLGLPMPALAEIEIVARDENKYRLVNYGAGAGTMRRESNNGMNYHIGNKRGYCAAPEVSMLSGFCDIHINQVLICNEEPSHPVQLVEQGRAVQVSYSYGLLLENLWVAMTRDKRSGRIKRSPVTAWLQCADRMRCLSKAIELTREGLEIVSYGYGRITVGIEESRWSDLPRIAFDHNLIPPVLMETNFKATSSRSIKVEQALSILHSNGCLDKILEYDMKAFDWLYSKQDAADAH